MDFGMGLSGTGVPAFTDNGAIFDDDAANAWVGGCGVKPALCQTQRLRHVLVVGGGEHDG
jgi:hypothetical protein